MPLVEIQNVSYAYPGGPLALDHVNLTIDDGECVGLVGPNGAGKSTLLWHLNGLLPERFIGRHQGRGAAANGHARHLQNGNVSGAGEGRGGNVPSVRVAGWEVNESNLPRVRRAVGLVFQDPDDQLFSPTVGDDVSFGPRNLSLARDEVARRVADALAAVGLEGFDDRHPHRLSLGERKRVSLAGVLACGPRLLALDEPTANLDPRARRQVISILARMECACLIATHDLELILELCSRVALLDGGRIHADGPASQVLSDERLLVEHGLELPASLRAIGPGLGKTQCIRP